MSLLWTRNWSTYLTNSSSFNPSQPCELGSVIATHIFKWGTEIASNLALGHTVSDWAEIQTLAVWLWTPSFTTIPWLCACRWVEVANSLLGTISRCTFSLPVRSQDDNTQYRGLGHTVKKKTDLQAWGPFVGALALLGPLLMEAGISGPPLTTSEPS